MTTIGVDVEDGIATCRLERSHGNAINEALVDDLMAASVRFEQDDSIRAIRLAGAGKLFCPGLDLQELVDLDRKAMAHFLKRFSASVLALYACARPIVATLHGHAVAGGCVLALTADWRVLREGAMIGLNEVKVGVPFPFGVSMILRESLHGPELSRVALLGDNLSGAEAVAAGLVHEVVPEADYEDRCQERLVAFAERDAYAFGMTKRYLRSATVERIRAHEGQFVDDFLDGWFSPATRERVEGIVASLRAREAGGSAG